MKIKITADSTCDLSEALLRQWDISLMPMHILMGGESYLDGITVRPADVFAHVEAGGQTPKSAAANPVEYIDFFGPFAKEYDAVIHISVSAKLSSCYQNACLAAEEVGGVFTIAFEEDGNVVMETNADDDDIYYDEISSGLLIAEIRRSRQELFESLSLYYRVFIKKEDVSALLDEEDGE